jgi:uncharacterized protein YerC
LKKLHERFADSITRVKKRTDATSFLKELLGPEELLMLAKRLAVVYMLTENISAYRIAQVLGLSTSTVNKMRLTFDEDGYRTIAAHYQHKKNHAEFWQDIEVLLRLGMPPMGKGRWKWFNELEDKYQSKS